MRMMSFTKPLLDAKIHPEEHSSYDAAARKYRLRLIQDLL